MKIRNDLVEKLKDSQAAVREMMLAVEFMRSACEHAEGKTEMDRERLSRAMSVGIRINARHAHRIEDYQQESFWSDVRSLPGDVGMENR